MGSKDEKFRKLVDENSDKILKVCRFYAKSDVDRQDLFQEVLINIWKSIDNFRGDSSIGTWIYRIALNTSLGFASKQFRHLQFTVDVDLASLQIVEETTSPDENIKEIERLKCCLNELSVIDKTIMSLVIEELSTREISEIIGITEPNVRVKIHRIKESLKTSMKGEKNE
jgi:RNA polymerase sigma-70 factor (ECF subfamily)